jgi:hypothetical protein
MLDRSSASLYLSDHLTEYKDIRTAAIFVTSAYLLLPERQRLGGGGQNCFRAGLARAFQNFMKLFTPIPSLCYSSRNGRAQA